MILDFISGRIGWQQALAWVVAIMVALIFHEVAHGVAAYALGDKTAKLDGRLSFNPKRHIDPLGLIIMLIVGFGWAKPVMVNPRNFKYPKQDMALVSFAGPFSNFLLAFIFMLILQPLIFSAAYGGTIVNIAVMFLILAIQINVMLGIFNLIPIPPLDGSKLLAAVLPDSLYYRYLSFERYGMIVLLVLVFLFSNQTSGFMGMIANAIINGLTWLVDKIYFFL